MRAVLLAAGYGTRLAPFTDATPKILLPIAGRPLLEHQLQYLAANGVESVAVNVSHHADQVVAFLDEADLPVRVRVSREDEPLGTAGALAPLRDFLVDTFLVLYGDVVTNASLTRLVRAHRRRAAIATLAYYVSNDTAEKGLLEVGDDGRLTGFVEKPAAAGPGRINAGIYVCEPEVLALVPTGRSDFGYEIWPKALSAGHALYAEPVDGYVHDVGSPSALSTVEREIAAGSISW